MAMATQPPSILLACSQSYQDGTRVSPLLAERRAIARLLEGAENQGACQLIQEDVAPHSSFMHLLEKHSFRQPISVLHVCGTYSEAENWELEALSAAIGTLPDLKLVFLNGCGSRELVEMLLLKDIPAVIATQSDTPNAELSLMAHTFYKSLGNGSSLLAAFEAVMASFPGKLAQFEAYYDLETDRLKWKGMARLLEDTFGDGLYVLEENVGKLSWHLPATEQQGLITEPEVMADLLSGLPIPGSDPTSKSWLTSGLVFMGLFITGLVLMALHMDIGRHEKWVAQEIPQLQQGNFHLVMLPIRAYNDCEKTGSAYTDLIFAQLKQLEQEEAEIKVNYGEHASCQPGTLAQHILRDQRAHMVIWGTYHLNALGDSMLNLHYAHLRQDGKILHQQLSRRLSEFKKYAIQGYPSLTEAMVYHAIGNIYYAQNKYPEAIRLLEKAYHSGIDEPPLTKALAQAYNRIGTKYVYQKQEDKAWFNFSRAIDYDSTFSEAFYNRGLINLKYKRYKEAIADMEQVIALGHSSGKPFGALAAIYASMGNEDAFYTYLERALEAGVDMKQFIRFTAIKRYQHKQRFRNLMVLYKQ